MQIKHLASIMQTLAAILLTVSTAFAASDSSPAGGPRHKSVMLYGRIEELCTVSGAKLPIQLKTLAGRFDTQARPHLTPQPIKIQVSTAFPSEFQGYWSGTLKVWASQFNQSRWQFDPAEAAKEQELLKPGTQGQVSFNFVMDNHNHLQLEPSQVVFTAPMSESRWSNLVGQMPELQSLMPDSGTAASLMKLLPYMYALHLGNLTYGVGVTGNKLAGTVLKNQVSVLKPGTVEQEIVTYNIDQNRRTGNERSSYVESVLRFTRTSADQLYVQAASVSYDKNGGFEDKIVLYGTINRGEPNVNQLSDFMKGGNIQRLFGLP